MMKRNVRIGKCLVILVLVGILLMPFSVYAADNETLGDLRRTYENLLAKKRENDNKTQAAKNEIAAKEAAIRDANDKIHEAEDQFDEAQVKINESNENIESLKLETEKVLQYMQQMQNENAYVEYVTGASSMTELIMRLEAVQQVSDYINKTIEGLQKEIKLNEQLKVELEQKQKNLESKIASYQATIEQVKIAKENLDANVKICKETIGKTDDSVKLSDCSKVPVNGGWLKPLVKGSVTSPEGYRTHPVTGAKYSFHSGIDIGGNSEGTKIYAAAAGQVAGIVRKSSCGGNRVYINVTVGGVKYTTFYYHLLSVNVKVGQVVTQNDVIGTVGGYSTSKSHGGYDSCTTGAHLHFGVAKGWFGGTSVPNSSVIVPPGFNNKYGYRFTSRTDYYRK